jgi:16S rRNA (guanine966-N2)-methyltransferase
MKRPPGKLRIIGGEYRSRIVAFDPATRVWPTPDRVRQTLFDWLAPVIEGARCVDLFAGSGTLGLEALSRGAAHVTFVETGASQAAAIRASLATLGAAARATVVQGDALAFLRSAPASSFEIAFLDPPFDAGLLLPALEALPRALCADARVYAEWSLAGPLPWPAGYVPIREKKAGQVSYALATVSSSHGMGATA